MKGLLERADLADELTRLSAAGLATHALDSVRLLTPVESQEVWAAGVTYLRSRDARMGESEFSASAYDRVYDAERPEIFFKSLPEKVVSPGEAVGIRRDARWNVPEPELALVINSAGAIVGYTIGNDMSSRDIEGENLLYLPQAKIYTSSCAVGPWIVVGPTEDEARQWTIQLEIRAAPRRYSPANSRRPDQTAVRGARPLPVPFPDVPERRRPADRRRHRAARFVHARSARRRDNHDSRRRHVRNPVSIV